MWFSVDRRVRFLHKQEKAAGPETLRGGVTPSGKAGRRGNLRRLPAVTGSLHFSVRGRTYGVVKTIFPIFTGLEWCRIYCGIILPLSYGFEIIKKKEHRFGRNFSPKRCSFLYFYFGCCKSCYTDMVFSSLNV